MPRHPGKHPPEQGRPVYAARWAGAEGNDYKVPVQFQELWVGLTSLILQFGPRSSDGTRYPAEIWEILCATVVRVLEQRDPTAAAALANALARTIEASGDLEDLARRVTQLELDTQTRRKPTYPPSHIRPVVHSLHTELRVRYRRGHGFTDEAKTYIEGWWRRRGEDDPGLSRSRAAYPQQELLDHVKPKGLAPQALAVFLVARRYGLSEETVRRLATKPQ